MGISKGMLMTGAIVVAALFVFKQLEKRGIV